MTWFETHWPRERVLAMNVHLITHPELAVQHWFELQIAAMGETPHGMREDASPKSGDETQHPHRSAINRPVQ